MMAFKAVALTTPGSSVEMQTCKAHLIPTEFEYVFSKNLNCKNTKA
jgi:hypothetical protein